MTKTKIKFRIFVLFAVFFLAIPNAQASEISASQVIKLVNESREKAGLEELKENKILDEVAYLKIQDMLENKYFEHTSPDGKTPWHWFSLVGYEYSYAGENLAIDFATAEEQHNAWMKSESHRKNILSDKFSEIGVAVARGKIKSEENSLVTVQVFGKPSVGSSVGEEKNFSLSQNSTEFQKGEIKGTVLATKDEEFIGRYEYKSLERIVWLFALIISLLILIINPVRWVGKSYEDIWYLLGDNFKKKFRFLKSLRKCENSNFKIKVKNLEGNLFEEIIKIKIRA